MKVGIVGFSGVGKTTIFNALTGLRAETGQGGRGRDNTGVIKVPDPRIAALSELHHSKKQVLAEIQFLDAAPNREGQGSARGLDTAVIQAMQGCEALVLVVRAFENPALEQAPDPARELTDFLAELMLADLGPLENRRERMKKETGREKEKTAVEKCIAHLEGERMLRTVSLDETEWAALAGFGLLSAKPLLCLLNQEEGGFTPQPPEALAAKAAGEGVEMLTISGQVEMDIAAMAPEEQGAFLEALGIAASARDRFVVAAYGLLELISFLTTGEDESRAWPIRRGTPAVKAAGKIHSDIERGFIRAEVIGYEELMTLGGEKEARKQGKLRREGKEYLVADGDVVNFLFNV